MNTCIMCGKEYKDTHPGRNTPREKQTCCRTCYLARLKRDGHWNTGLKWEDIYNEETLETLKKRISATGEDSINWGRERPDVALRNFFDNPMTKNKSKKEIQKTKRKILEKLSNNAVNELFKGMGANKAYAYQRKAWKHYGRKCAICDRVTGQIDVHHIDGNTKHNDLDNLVVLCASHHAILHKRNLTVEQLKRQFR